MLLDVIHQRQYVRLRVRFRTVNMFPKSYGSAEPIQDCCVIGTEGEVLDTRRVHPVEATFILSSLRSFNGTP